jgi:hypothetical protein
MKCKYSKLKTTLNLTSLFDDGTKRPDGLHQPRANAGTLGRGADFETWLSGSPAEAFALARSFDRGAMRIVQSGFEKKDLLAA